jgi:hypothetical protein
MMAKRTGQKGFAAEEALRSYFRSTGHFVVRGIPLVYRKYDVTDVDLWLYVKASTLATERTCVDVKRRRTPQAMERVLWTKGLKEVLGVERAIVVTSDNRAETREFGDAHGVGILQGEFLKRVIDAYPPSDRLTEEELLSLLKTPCVIDASLDWRAWYRRAKSTLLSRLNFDGCNSFLLRAKLLLDEYCATGGSEAPTRLLYVVIAYLLICVDRTSRSCVSLDVAARASILTDGFRYGEAGHQRTEEVVQMALQLLADAGKTDLFSGESLRDEFDRQVSEYRADILGEYFSKSDVLKNLFHLAGSFEMLAYSKPFKQPNEIPNEQKALVGLICDFVGQDRKAIL